MKGTSFQFGKQLNKSMVLRATSSCPYSNKLFLGVGFVVCWREGGGGGIPTNRQATVKRKEENCQN